VTDLPLHFEASATIGGSVESIFAIADEPDLLTPHMSEPSLMMGGGSMRYNLDALAGKAVGSVIRLTGKGFGLAIIAERSSRSVRLLCARSGGRSEYPSWS
jgi:hypothetical protein